MPGLRIVNNGSLPVFGDGVLIASGSDFCISALEFQAAKELEELQARVREVYSPERTIGACPQDWRAKAVFFDMDATVIEEESLVALSKAAGTEKEVARITTAAMGGAMDFGTALRERLALVSGLPVSKLEDLATNLTLTPGIATFCQFCRSEGVPIFLISGGFTKIAGPLASSLGMADYCANELEERDGKLTGRWVGDLIDRRAKGLYVKNKCAEMGWQTGEVAVVGDGANDLDMMALAGVAVGFRPKQVLYPHVHGVDGIGDHRFLAALLFGKILGK